MKLDIHQKSVKRHSGSAMVSWILTAGLLWLVLFVKIHEGQSAAELLVTAIKNAYSNEKRAGYLP